MHDFSADDGVSPGICHTVAREKIIEPGDFIQATDSHTCMGGALGALAYGVGATEYAALIHAGFTFVVVPESIRFELIGALRPGVTAKDVMLYILANHAKPQQTLDRVMEFGGPGLRVAVARRARDPGQHGDRVLGQGRRRRGRRRDARLDRARIGRAPPSTTLRAQVVAPDRGAEYAGGVHTIDLSTIRPMVATPGDAAQGHPLRSDQRRLHRARSATCASTSPTAARAPPARKTTSTCTRA